MRAIRALLLPLGKITPSALIAERLDPLRVGQVLKGTIAGLVSKSSTYTAASDGLRSWYPEIGLIETTQYRRILL